VPPYIFNYNVDFQFI